MSRDESKPLFWQSWTIAKDGNTPEQNEDAARVEACDGGVLLAVADGASEAVYAGHWARALVAAVEADWPACDDVALTERLDRVRAAFAPIAPDEVVPW